MSKSNFATDGAPYQISANLKRKFKAQICCYYEFAHECKFIRPYINQNTTLNLLLKARIKSTSLQTVTPRVDCASTEGQKHYRRKRYRQKRGKITIQRNSARQHKAMTYDVIA